MKSLLLSFLVFLLGTSPVLAQRLTIGVSIPSATHGWTGGVNWWARETARQLERQHRDVRFVLVASPNAQEQANALEDLVAVHRIDALVILPFESAPLTAPVQRVKQQGKFVTVVDRGLTEPGIEDLYVAGDNPGLGRVSAEFIAARLGGRGKIVVLRGMPVVIDGERFDAFMDVIQGTDIEVLAAQYANWNRDDGFKVMQDFLTRFPHIDAVWAQDDDIAIGVFEAIRQANRREIQFVVGGAGMKEMIKRVMDGDPMVPVNVLYSPRMIATAMELTVARLKKTTDETRVILPATLVTPENAAEHYFPNSPF
jgi:ribose transport system substrate-binding protein